MLLLPCAAWMPLLHLLVFLDYSYLEAPIHRTQSIPLHHSIQMLEITIPVWRLGGGLPCIQCHRVPPGAGAYLEGGREVTLPAWAACTWVSHGRADLHASGAGRLGWMALPILYRHTVYYIALFFGLPSAAGCNAWHSSLWIWQLLPPGLRLWRLGLPPLYVSRAAA